MFDVKLFYYYVFSILLKTDEKKKQKLQYFNLFIISVECTRTCPNETVICIVFELSFDFPCIDLMQSICCIVIVFIGPSEYL